MAATKKTTHAPKPKKATAAKSTATRATRKTTIQNRLNVVTKNAKGAGR